MNRALKVEEKEEEDKEEDKDKVYDAWKMKTTTTSTSRRRSSRRSQNSSFLKRRTIRLFFFFFLFVLGFVCTPTTTMVKTFVNADSTGKPEVGRDPREIPNWNDYREHFTLLNEDVASRTDASDGNTPWIEHVSWEPRVFVYHNFLSEKEAKYLRDAHKKASKAMDDESMKTTFKRGQDPIVNVIEQ